MKSNNIIKFIFLLSVVSIVAIVISKFTYKNIDGRITSKMLIKKNVYAGHGQKYRETHFNFHENINTIIYKLKTGDKNIYPNIECISKKINNIIPISLAHKNEIGIYTVEIISSSIKNNQLCFDSILKILRKTYHDTLTKTIDNILIEQNIIREINNKIYMSEFKLKKEKEKKAAEKYQISLEEKMNIKFIKKNEIPLSKFLNYLKKKEIVETFIGGGYVSGKLTNGLRFFSIFKNIINSDFLITKLYESGTTITIIDTNAKKKMDSEWLSIPVSVSLPNHPLSELNYVNYIIELSIIKKKLSLNPYILLETKHDYYKIDYYNYLILFLIAFNLSVIVIFLITNKKFSKNFKKLLNKITK